MAKSKKISFEDKYQRLNEILDLLEEAEISLDEQIKIYEEGMKLSKELKEYLEKAELKINEISEKNQSNKLIL